MTGCVVYVQPERGRNRGAYFLWAAAALAVAAAHAGAIAVIMREPEVLPSADAGAPAMTIDLAAMPQAVETDANTQSDQTEDAPEVDSTAAEMTPVETPPDPAPTPDAVAQDAPVAPPSPDQVAAAVADAAPAPMEAPPPPPVPEVQTAAVALPKVQPEKRPEPPKEKPAAEQPKPRKAERAAPPPPASKAANRAAATVQQSTRNAAAQTAAAPAAADTSAVKSWRGKLMSHLERRKRYPSSARARREEGVARVAFRIDAAGNVLSASIAQSSGSAALDAATLDMIRRASPVPAPPPGVALTITAPIRYDLR